MAITHVGSTALGSTVATLTPSITAPSGIQATNCILLAITVAGTRTFTWPSGFTEIDYGNVSGTTVAVAYKIASGSESSTALVVTVSGAAGPKPSLVCSVYAGTDATSPINAFDAAATTTNAVNYTTPSVNTSTAQCAEVSFVAKTRGSVTPQITSFTAPSPLTKAAEAFSTEATSMTAIAVGYNLTGVGSGATIGGRTWVADQASQSGGATVALKPADAGGGGGSSATSVTHRASTSVSGTGSSTSASVTGPATIEAGDCIIMTITVASTRTITWPSGFNEIEYANITGTTLAVAYKMATGPESGATLTATISGTAGPKISMICAVYYGTHPTAPINGSDATASSANISGYNTPSLVTDVAQCAEISIIGMTRGNTSPQITSFTAPSPLTKNIEAFTTAGSGSAALGLGHNLVGVSSGSTVGNRLWSSDQSAQGAGATIALRPASAVDGLAVDAGQDQVVEPFTTVTISASSTGGVSPTISWAQSSGTSVVLSGSGATRTFNAPAVMAGATLIFTATATESSTSASSETIVTVYPATDFVRSGSSWSPIEIIKK